MKLTKELYKKAVIIYLKNAYDNEDIINDRLAWLKNPMFFVSGIPDEARFGCKYNPHMKLMISYNGKLFVYPNDYPDDRNIQIMDRIIKDKIENEWRDNGFDVLE